MCSSDLVTMRRIEAVTHLSRISAEGLLAGIELVPEAHLERLDIDAYKKAADEGRVVLEVGQTGYPPTLDALVEGVSDARNPESAAIYFLRRVPRDPFYPDPDAPASTTWSLRSYASPPDDPQPGDDVYDVHSLSNGTSLAGDAYRDW